ncbi:putative RNA recognition motif domain, nucleotide-binding alpha-beta plait domain superfamily [Plasmopara halstedii]
MSGFERILARVSGDALSSYCSSAIEDELRNLQTRMKACLESVEQAQKVQEAVAKLDVPLSRENAATCVEIKRKYSKFSANLKHFIDEQRKLQAEAPEASADAEQKQSELQRRERVLKLLGKIQHRITRKRNDTWIEKNFADVDIIASIIKNDTFTGLDKALRNELVLVLDHLISAVLLSPLTSQTTLEEMGNVLNKMAKVHDDIDEYIRSSSELLERKREAYAPQTVVSSTNPDAEEEPKVKKQRVESTPTSDILVKLEHTAAAGDNGPYEVFVSELPWGTTNEADVSSYFGIAGAVLSVQMPTMTDGSTVGVAVVRFAALEGMTLALRMDGYPFNGKYIRVAVHKAK